MSDDLVDTQEMYLKAIFELEEEGVVPMRARLVERLAQSKPTVSETVARMERDGLLYVDSKRRLVLTPEGRTIATRVMRKHRLAERLLVDVLKMPWEHVHPEACRWEHVMSSELEQCIVNLVGDEGSDPYGNPIPSEVVTKPATAQEAGLVTLGSWAKSRDAQGAEQATSGGQVIVDRFGEPLQTDTDTMTLFARNKIFPGVKVDISHYDDDVVMISKSGEKVLVTPWATQHIFVRTQSDA
ncbi:metal-dependent transcriptional regulator [Actinotignum urinale]|uniref:Metal-dependent transcriptional regulator n=1 Tax=Actinotignum urinale TaxID=190146 RepID=A0ABU5G6R2_9ACTO|nr:metal-dependent transcriptional regulator [Actinotignum urinale]MDY5133035.1 metal-dependent transcriptional regulator [Actinotignum urinale]